MHLRAQQALRVSLAMALLAGECGCHGLIYFPRRALLQGSSSSTADGPTGSSAAAASSTPQSASASSSASSTGGTAMASSVAGPSGTSTNASVSPSPASPAPPPPSPKRPSPKPVPVPSLSEVEVNVTLNETYVGIYNNIEKRVEDGESLTSAAKDEVRASRFQIATIWAKVLGAVDGVDCQNELALVKVQAEDFAQGLANGLFEAKGSLPNADEIKEVVAEMMELAFEDAVEAACAVAGFTIGPEFIFALRLVDPVAEGYVLAGVGKAGGPRPRSLPPSPKANNETSSSSSSTSTNGETSTSSSTSTSGDGSTTASASASGSSTSTTTTTTNTATSTSTSSPAPAQPPAKVNGAADVCERPFTVCCLDRKILSGKCDCVGGRCDATYVDDVWEDASGEKCTCS